LNIATTEGLGSRVRRLVVNDEWRTSNLILTVYDRRIDGHCSIALDRTGAGMDVTEAVEPRLYQVDSRAQQWTTASLPSRILV